MDKKSARIRRATRARRKLQELGATRLVVHRTPRHIYAQVIAPNGSEVLVAASTVEKAIAEQLKYTGNKDAAAAVGKAVAERALEKGIKDVSFDRSGFQYHGRVQALADAPKWLSCRALAAFRREENPCRAIKTVILITRDKIVIAVRPLFLFKFRRA